HHLLGEGLRAFDPGRGRARAETRDTGLAQGIGGARDQRRLRADDDQVGAELAGQREDVVRRGRRVRVSLGQGLDAGVARGGVDVVLTEGADQGVLSPPGTDDEYAHAWRLPEQVPDLQGLIPARADADRADRGADHLLHRADVGARVGRQLVERPRLGDVLPPAVEVLVDRYRVVELG